MYVQYKVNVSENQVDAIRLKKGVTLRFPKAGIRGDHVLLNMSAKQVARNVSCTAGFIGMLASLAAHDIPLVDRALPTILSGLATGLLSGEMYKK